MQIIIGGIYKHYKRATEYKVLGIAKHSETLEDCVVYEALSENPMSKLWVRPLIMFLEEVELDGVKQNRFQFIKKI